MEKGNVGKHFGEKGCRETMLGKGIRGKQVRKGVAGKRAGEQGCCRLSLPKIQLVVIRVLFNVPVLRSGQSKQWFAHTLRTVA